MANIEAIIIQWLGTIAPEYPASGDKPAKPPEKFILVDRTGGPREAMVLDRAEILIEVYNKTSRASASDEANVVADLVPQLQAYDDNITHAKVNSVVNLDDTLAQYHRYQIYCDVYHRR